MKSKENTIKKTKEEKIPNHSRIKIILGYIISMGILAYVTHWTFIIIQKIDNIPTIMIITAITVEIIAVIEFLKYGFELIHIKDIINVQRKTVTEIKDMTDEEIIRLQKQLQDELETNWNNNKYIKLKTLNSIINIRQKRKDVKNGQ